jgi:hypothetical protein
MQNQKWGMSRALTNQAPRTFFHRSFGRANHHQAIPIATRPAGSRRCRRFLTSLHIIRDFGSTIRNSPVVHMQQANHDEMYGPEIPQTVVFLTQVINLLYHAVILDTLPCIVDDERFLMSQSCKHARQQRTISNSHGSQRDDDQAQQPQLHTTLTKRLRTEATQQNRSLRFAARLQLAPDGVRSLTSPNRA